MFMIFTAVIVSSLLHQYVQAEDGQFYGGSMSYKMEKQADGKDLVTIELITGWVLGKGPCGPGCNKSDICRSTRSTRPIMTAVYDDYLGLYTSDYTNRSTRRTEVQDMTAFVLSTYNETVIAVSENGQWEQELLHFSFTMPDNVEQLDVNFDGTSWRKLTLQNTSSGRYHFQTTVSTSLRSDTGSPNQSPQAFAKPFYRVKLGVVTGIHIPAVDADGDIIICDIAEYVEGGDIAIYPPPNVHVFKNCTVYINASESSGYTDDSWIAVPVSVRDYNRKKIVYGRDEYYPAKFSLSATAVQFTVQVLANLITPEFVEPTLESNHLFIMYADTTLRTEIYANAPANTTIDSFTAIGLQREQINLSPVQQDPRRPQVKYAIMSWKPSTSEIGGHILCLSTGDTTGVHSEEERCFIMDVKADAFNHTSNVTAGKPYFVDIPSPDQFVECKIHATCVVALYVKSTVEVIDVHVTDSYIDKYKLGPVHMVTHKGEQMYQTDLSFEHSWNEKENICFMAKDKHGAESEDVCIQIKIDPQDACASAPCLNSGTCVMDEDTGGFNCLCLSGYSGKLCDIGEDKCRPDPCVIENTVICAGVPGMLCYCKPGFEGDTCDKNTDDCHANACNGHGSCKDKANGFDCECFSRYNGTHCENDTCPTQARGTMSCPAAGCEPNPCQVGAVCLSGGRCACSYGFSGNRCETRTCDISGAVTGIEIISPSAADGSKFVCYTQGDIITSCKSRIYMAVKSGVNPNIDVETTSDLKSIITVGPITKSSVLPGVSTMYSTDVTIRGIMNSTKLQYFCVHASVGTLKSSACYELSLISDPESDPKTLAYTQRNAHIKFVQPTLKDRSRILCEIGEKCHVLMYTSFASSRSTCLSAPTASSGSSTGCDSNDKDNDQDDPDTSAKTSDPCCDDVLSSTADVTVYPSHPRGPSCVTEASFIIASAGEKEICFQSSKASFQQVCYKVGVYNSTSDPCFNSPCLNNGHCFHSDHNNFKCICDDNYNGDRCQKGPCQLADNNCQHEAYCQTYDGVATCICRAGYSGQTCNKDPSSFHKSTAEFTDTAKPLVFPCVIHQTCSIALLLTGPSGHVPLVAPGYVDSSIVLGGIETADRITLQGSYQTDIKIKPFELGVKDMCIQTMNITGVNKDEICFKVNVISDVISLYGLKDRPHFIEPSMPTNTEVECLAEGPCHVLYHVTPGTGNENECVIFHAHPPDGFVNYHLYSSCNNCTPGGPSNGNCTVDVSVVNSNADIDAMRHFCLSVGLKGSTAEGEIRCFNITVKDPSKVGKTGCQVLECGNGGFCDGHDPSQPVCFCRMGFSGTNCERGLAEIKSSMSNTQNQTFIGDFAVPSKIICIVNTSCPVPFQIVSKPGITPAVSLGFNDPRLVVTAPSLKALASSSTVFEGSTVATPNTVGDFSFCLQANLNSKTDDEMCVLVEVTSKSIDKTDKTKPYFLSPTIPTDSTVLCAVHKACHFDMHFTNGDNFGFIGRCPTLTETTRSPVQGVHIFDAKRQAMDCTTDVTYIPSEADGEHKLCLQVSLPGKKGEDRCFIIKVVNDTHKEVLSPCRGVTCDHAGTCLANFKSTSPTTSCICAPGFSGTNCETDIDDCRPDSCRNGATCVDSVNNYTCACKLGFTGRDCEKDFGDCVPNPCQNGATCTDDGNNYTCKCALGYTGQNCDIVIDPCSFNPCVRGTCFHHAPLYHCLCPSGYTGKKCEISIDECISHPCLHGGICVNHTGYFTCNCSSGFVGNTCETDVNECISQPCLNGGFCKDGIDHFLCECRAGYDGERCQNVVDPCVRNPCMRGICFSHGSQFLCECPKGFTEEVCETTMTVNGPKETYLRVSTGSELKLNCSVSGQNVLTFYWSKRNGCGFKFGNMKASVYRQPHVFIGDAGTYICTTSDGYGPNITKYFHVDIISIQKDEVCDFDDGTLCGWEQQKNDSFDWTFQSGPTQSAGTGPDVDHTLGTVQGKYIYIESSSPRRFGEHASLLSHVLPANRTMCFMFWYYMFGDGSGGLSVLLQDTCLNTETQLFKESGDKGAQWNKASISITRQYVPNDYRIVLKADVGPTFHGDTALDDLVIHDGSCQGSQGAPIVG